MKNLETIGNDLKQWNYSLQSASAYISSLLNICNNILENINEIYSKANESQKEYLNLLKEELLHFRKLEQNTNLTMPERKHYHNKANKIYQDVLSMQKSDSNFKYFVFSVGVATLIIIKKPELIIKPAKKIISIFKKN